MLHFLPNHFFSKLDGVTAHRATFKVLDGECLFAFDFGNIHRTSARYSGMWICRRTLLSINARWVLSYYLVKDSDSSSLFYTMNIPVLNKIVLKCVLVFGSALSCFRLSAYLRVLLMPLLLMLITAVVTTEIMAFSQKTQR